MNTMNTTTMNTTRPKLLLLLLIGASSTPLIQGFQLQQQQRTTKTRTKVTAAKTSSSLSVGAADYDYDYFQEDNNNADIGIEAAIAGSAYASSSSSAAYVSEYEQDAEFYKRRNEAYYNSIYKEDDEDNNENEIIVQMLHQGTVDVSDSDSSSSNSNSNSVSMINTSLKASHTSFKHVEEVTNSLLKGKPLLAIAIFALAGCVVAYLSGFFFLGNGYIENSYYNPFAALQNVFGTVGGHAHANNMNMVPYWDDAEIHTIQRAVMKQ